MSASENSPTRDPSLGSVKICPNPKCRSKLRQTDRTCPYCRTSLEGLPVEEVAPLPRSEDKKSPDSLESPPPSPEPVRKNASKHAILKEMRDRLLYLCNDPKEIKMLVEEAGCQPGTVDLIGTAERQWHEALNQIARLERLDHLVDVFAKRYAEHKKYLEDLVRRFWTAPGWIRPSTKYPWNRAYPYPGVAPFQGNDRALFFGREAEIKEALDSVRKHPVTLILGHSGSGKSSFVNAGLIPAWEENQSEPSRVVVLRPDLDPFEALYCGLIQAGFSQAEARFCREPSEEVFSRLAERLDTKDLILFVIDQFEQILYPAEGEESVRNLERSKREKFATALAAGARTMVVGTRNAQFRFVVVLREAYLKIIEKNHATLFQKLAPNEICLRNLSEHMLREVIERPAFEHGVDMVDDLAEQLVRDVQAHPDGALPLLQRVLRRLWQFSNQGGDGQKITLTHYKELGGVKGILGKAMKELHDSQSPADRESLGRCLFRMLDFRDAEAGLKAIPQTSALSAFCAEEDREQMRRLVDREKLVIAVDSKDGPCFELALPSSIASWPAYRSWLQDGREYAKKRQDFRDFFDQWDQNNQSDENLLTGWQLGEFRDIQKENGFARYKLPPLNDPEQHFLAVSQRAEGRKRKRLKLVVALMTLLALSASSALIVAVTKGREASLNQAKALRNQADGHVNAAEYPQAALVAARALGFDQFDGKASLSVPAYPRLILDRPENYRLIDHLTRIASGHVLSGLINPMPVWCSLPIPLPEGKPENPARTLVFSPDYRWIAAGSRDGKVRIYPWKQALLEPRVLDSPGNQEHRAIRDLKISPSGDRLVIAYEGREKESDFFAVWEIDRSEPSEPRFLHRANHFCANINRLDFSPDGARLVTVGGITYDNGNVALWDLANLGGPVAESTLPERNVYDVAWSPDGNRIAVACHRMVQIIDPSNAQPAGDPVHLYPEPDNTDFSALAFSNDGEFLAAGATNRELYIWKTNKTTPSGFEPVVSQSVHRYPVRDLVFTPGGASLVTSSLDGEVKVWNTRRLPKFQLEATLMADSPQQDGYLPSVHALAISPDGNFLLTGLIDSTLRLWSLGRRDSLVLEQPGNVESVSLTTKTRLLATAWESQKGSGGFKVYDLKNENLLWSRDFALPERKGFALRLETHFLPGEKRLLTFRRPAGPDEGNCIELFDATTGQLIDATSPGKDVIPRVAAFSANGERILIATPEGDCFVARFDPQGDRLPKPGDFLPIADAKKGLVKTDVWDVELSDDGTRAVMTGRQDPWRSFVHIMDTASLSTRFHTHAGPNAAMCVAFSPDGRQLAVGTHHLRLIYLFDAESGEKTGALKGHHHGITALRYLPDGIRLASGSRYDIRLWNTRTRNEIAAIAAHDKQVQELAWELRDGAERLISGAEEPFVKFWPLTSGNPNLRAYLLGGENAWFNFNRTDDVLEWNNSPRAFFLNLPPLSTIGRIVNWRDGDLLDRHLFIESIRVGNWDSATILSSSLPKEQRGSRSLVIDQSAGKALSELRRQAELPGAPINFINRRIDQILALLPKEEPNQPMGLRQELNLLKTKINQPAATANPSPSLQPEVSPKP